MARGIDPLILPLLALVAASPRPALAWDDHSLLTRPALERVPGIVFRPPAEVEPLEHFLAAEEVGLAALLAEEDAWAAAQVPTWPALPPALAFRAGGDPATRRARFLEALRVAPDARLALYLKLPPDAVAEGGEGMPWADVTTLRDPGALGHARLRPLAAGEGVAPLEVLISACDEPDYGLDLGLWEDSGTPWGRRYGLGAQPFGDPAKEYGSQAPLHMGLYHESAIVYFAAGFLRRTYPEVRVHQFRALARYAIATGHDYWGWRFGGWALHYVQDQTMPYHARVLPGVGVLRMLWVSALDLLGFPGPRADTVRQVSNRHTVVEQWVRETLEVGEPEVGASLRAALADVSGDFAYSPWDERSLRDGVAAGAAARADALDAALVRWVPARLVSDPGYVMGETEPDVDLRARVQGAGPTANAALEPVMAPLLADFGAASRVFLASLGDER
jgi:hypothetical protein